jgi:glycine hydroxymethyltransferase
VIAAKAVAFKEALAPDFKRYQRQVIANARAMAAVLAARGYKIVSGGTDDHLFLLDLIDKDVTGKDADAWLGAAHITVNKNSVPNDPRSPFVTSGLRIGTPAVTTRGFRETEAHAVAGWIADVLDAKGAERTIERVRREVAALCARFPVYGDAGAAKPKPGPARKAKAKRGSTRARPARKGNSKRVRTPAARKTAARKAAPRNPRRR